MIRFIMLFSGAILLIINTLSAQGFTSQHLEAPKKKKEIGLNFNQFTGTQLTFKKEISEQKYWRIDAGISATRFFQKGSLGFGIENRVPLKGKFSMYHGWNVNIGYASLKYNPFDPIRNVTTLSLGYRLGMRYDINKHLYIGAEVNPQIGILRRNNASSVNIIQGNIQDFNSNRLKFVNGLGAATFNVGVKF